MINCSDAYSPKKKEITNAISMANVKSTEIIIPPIKRTEPAVRNKASSEMNFRQIISIIHPNV